MATAKKTPPAAGRRQLSPAVTNDPVAAAATKQGEGVIESAQAAAEAKAQGEEVVTVNVPRAFRLTLDDRTEVAYHPGAAMMPISHAEHWYAQANGVTILKK